MRRSRYRPICSIYLTVKKANKLLETHRVSRTDMAVMSFLYLSDDPPTPAEIMRELEFSNRQATLDKLKDLVRKDYIEILFHSGKKRYYDITKSGLKILYKLNEAYSEAKEYVDGM